MIYCNLKGGLGNMLFQIATAKSLSIDNDTECSFPNLYNHLKYLNYDNTHNPKLNYSIEYLDLLGHLRNDIPGKIKKVIYPFNYVETPKIVGDVLIDGFFQSEKYFIHNRKEILKLFNFSTIHNNTLKKYNDILNKKTTSIHVRRGDYIKFPNHHITQPIEYYNKSIELLKNKTDLFIVFSDDIMWCKNNLKIKNSIYIENEKDYIELYLMSLCKHNIICNSSFSWWAAWLNKNKNKIIIGPKKWFGSSINYNSDDIIPKNWIKL
tara:strand:- start:7898 stop:8692 length:795 start_codon:yes stop_codon:yes gene_type:complete